MTTTENATKTLLIVDHSDNTGTDEDYATYAEALTSLEEFANEEGLMTAEATDGGFLLLDDRGNATHTAYIN